MLLRLLSLFSNVIIVVLAVCVPPAVSDVPDVLVGPVVPRVVLAAAVLSDALVPADVSVPVYAS